MDHAATLNAVRHSIAATQTGESITAAPLQLWPLFVSNGHTPHYDLLTTALSAGTARVSELNEQGQVPSLRVENLGTRPLLIPEGEILVGAKQNRVVNATVMVAADLSIELAVSCVERGRWRYQSAYFTSSGHMPPHLRSAKLTAMREQKRRPGAPHSQHVVWDRIDAALHAQQIDAPTSSLTEMHEAHRSRLDALRQSLQLPDRAAGLLATMHGRVIGLDLFDCPRTFAAYRDRLLDSYAMAGLDAREQQVVTAPDNPPPADFIARVGSCIELAERAGSVGHPLDLGGEELAGSGVFDAGRLCHLCVFPAQV